MPKVREQFEECLAKNIQPEEYEITGETDGKSDEKTAEISVKGCLYAAQTGDVIPLENVPDDVFSQKVMGEGIAVIPKDTLVTAPAAGEVAVVAETKHAYAIAAEDGTEILIHIGLETVNLKGKGFESLVKPGDRVEVGTPFCKVDESLVKGEVPLYTPMIITNSDDVKNLKIYAGSVTAGKDCVIEYEK